MKRLSPEQLHDYAETLCMVITGNYSLSQRVIDAGLLRNVRDFTEKIDRVDRAKERLIVLLPEAAFEKDGGYQALEAIIDEYEALYAHMFELGFTYGYGMGGGARAPEPIDKLVEELTRR